MERIFFTFFVTLALYTAGRIFLIDMKNYLKFILIFFEVLLSSYFFITFSEVFYFDTEDQKFEFIKILTLPLLVNPFILVFEFLAFWYLIRRLAFNDDILIEIADSFILGFLLIFNTLGNMPDNYYFTFITVAAFIFAHNYYFELRRSLFGYMSSLVNCNNFTNIMVIIIRDDFFKRSASYLIGFFDSLFLVSLLIFLMYNVINNSLSIYTDIQLDSASFKINYLYPSYYKKREIFTHFFLNLLLLVFPIIYLLTNYAIFNYLSKFSVFATVISCSMSFGYFMCQCNSQASVKNILLNSVPVFLQLILVYCII